MVMEPNQEEEAKEEVRTVEIDKNIDKRRVEIDKIAQISLFRCASISRLYPCQSVGGS